MLVGGRDDNGVKKISLSSMCVVCRMLMKWMLLSKFYCRASKFLKYSIALGKIGQNGGIVT
jgi:hypothetical protein